MPEESQIRCEDKIEKHMYGNTVKKHRVTQPAVPWYEICIQSKSKHNFRRRARPKVLAVLPFDYSVTDTQQGQPHLDLIVGTDMSTGTVWASAVIVRGKEDPYIVSSILSWLSEIGHSSHHTVRR